MFFRHIVLQSMLMTAVILVLSGCGSDNKGSANSKVVAEVDGEIVSEGMFNAYLDYKRIPKNDTKAIDRELDGYLEREGLARVIQKQNLLDPMRIETEVNEFRKQIWISLFQCFRVFSLRYWI